MKKYSYLIFTLLILCGCSKDQKNLNEEKVSSDSISVYFALFNNESTTLTAKSLYNKRALEILKKQKNDSIKIGNLFKVANNYFTLSDWNSFRLTSKMILKYSIEAKDTVNIAKAYRYNAEYYKNINVNDSAFYYYLKAEKLFTRLNDKLNLGRIFLKKGIVQFYANDYLGADISTSQAYNLLKSSEDKDVVYQAISMIGIIANEMKDYNKAIEKHKEALKLVQQYNLNNYLNQEATSLNNIGNVYQNLDKNKEAIANFQLALKDDDLRKETPDLYAILLDNLAYSKFKLREFNELPTLFFKSL